MLKKFARVLALGLMLGMLPLMPAEFSNPVFAQEITQKAKEVDNSEKDEPEEDSMIFEFPKLTGPYGVGTTARHIIDEHRKEPHNPSAQRELMIHLWYPAEVDKETLVPYRADEIAPTKAAFRKMGYPEEDLNDLDVIRSHALPEAPVIRTTKPLPVILFSHGFLGCGPADYTAMCEELASHGFIVASIAHTYYATVVSFPDGRQIGTAPEKYAKKEADFTADQEIWLQDAQCVLNQLEKINANAKDSLYKQLDLDRIGMIGHSFGGSTAFELCAKDERCSAGINLDAAVYGTAIISSMRKPFLFIFAQSTIDLFTNFSDEELAEQQKVSVEHIKKERERFARVYPLKSSQNIKQLVIPGIEHGGFSDLLLLKELPLHKKNRQRIDLEKMAGSADGFATMKHINELIVHFFNKNL